MTSLASPSHDPGGSPAPASSHTLQCMEIWSGNEARRDTLSAPGLDVWVDTQPYRGEASGGDIHYFSMCGSGRVTRLAVADVSGHGLRVNQMAQSLRKLMRKYINMLDQTRFAKALNKEFGDLAESGRFATVLLTTYFAPTDHLILCNAGHPRPLWYTADTRSWSAIDPDHPRVDDLSETRIRYNLTPVTNLPLGIIDPTEYHQFAVKLGHGDIILIYTDAMIEARNARGDELGEEGLLRMASALNVAQPQQLTDALLEKVSAWRGGRPAEDDQTLVVMHHNASDPPKMTLTKWGKTITRMLGLVPV